MMWPNRQAILWRSKMWTVFLDQRISLAVVTITDEDGEIDILARSSGICSGDCCAPRIFVKAACSAFRPELKVCGRKEDYTHSVLTAAWS